MSASPVIRMATWPGFHLPRAGSVVAWADDRPGAPVLVEQTVADTRDLRLTRAGIELVHERTPAGGTWRLVLPLPDRAPYVRSWDGPAAAGGSPPPEAVAVVRAVARREPVVAVARLEIRRTPVDWVDGGGRRAVVLFDDEVSVLDDGRVTARWRAVEVHVDAAAPAGLLDRILEGLSAAGAGPAGTEPPWREALGPRRHRPPDAAPPPVEGDATAADLVHAAIAGAVCRLVQHDPIVRLDLGPVGVHQCRVATRRLRSDLRTFGPLVDREWAEGLRGALRELAAELGAVRDPDVMGMALAADAATLPEPDAAEAAQVIAALAADRDRALAALHAVLDAEPYLALLDRLVDAAEQPRFADAGLAGRPAREVVPAFALRPWKRLRRAVRALDDDSPDERLHETRVLAKRARYALEAVSPVIPGAAAHAKAVAALQDVLGEHQDAVVAETWLRSRVAGATAEQAFALGLLAAVQRERQRRTRAQWPAVWAAADRRRLRWWRQ